MKTSGLRYSSQTTSPTVPARLDPLTTKTSSTRAIISYPASGWIWQITRTKHKFPKQNWSAPRTSTTSWPGNTPMSMAYWILTSPSSAPSATMQSPQQSATTRAVKLPTGRYPSVRWPSDRTPIWLRFWPRAATMATSQRQAIVCQTPECQAQQF